MRRSGGPTFVVVMQTADMRDLDDRTAGRRLRSPWDGSILVQGEVSSPLVIVAEIGHDRPTEADLVEHDDVVQALAANGSDHPFDVRPGVSCRLHRQRAVRRKPFVLPTPSIRCVAGRFS